MGTFSEKFSNWKAERQLAQLEHICVIPSDLCFMSTCPLPEGKINHTLARDMALLSLESTSPFPLSNIFWRYFIDVNMSAIHIFSVLKSRLKVIDPEVEFSTYILPDFLLAIIHPTIAKAILKYRDNGIVFEKTVANGISFKPIDASNGEGTTLPIFELVEFTSIVEFGLVVKFTQQENASSRSIGRVYNFSFSHAVIGAANMQNLELKKIQKRNKMTTNGALYATLISSILIFTGICGLFWLQYLSAQENRIAKKLASKEEQVKLIQQKEARAHELDLFSNRKHAYFRGLEEVNKLRPNSIYFTSLYASEGERFEIKGNAKTLDELNKFEEILSKSTLFKVVKVENKQIQDNQSINFSLFLTFEKL
jgi:Tfp pilus assembly protein PilN